MNELVVPSEEHGRSFYAPAPKPAAAEAEASAEVDAWSDQDRDSGGGNPVKNDGWPLG